MLASPEPGSRRVELVAWGARRALGTLGALGVLIALVPGAGRAQVQVDTSTARPITLADALRLADRNAPATVQARNEIATSRGALRAAYGAFVPNLALTASRSYQGGTILSETGRAVPYTGQPWRSGDALSLTTTLFAGGRRVYDVQSARATLAASEATETTQRFAVALTVDQAYYNALAARESEAAAEAQLREAQQAARFAFERVAAKMATRSDSLRAIIDVRNAEIARLTALTNLANANATLTRLTGSTATLTADPADTLETAPIPLDTAALRDMAEHGPLVQQLSAVRSAASATERSTWTAYLPQLDATLSYNGTGFDPYYGLATPFAYGTSVRFTLSYPLFDGFQRELTHLRAEVAETNAEATLRDAQLGARQQLTQTIGSVRLAQERIASQRAAVEAAEEDLRVQNQRYSVGMSTLLDVLTSQTALNQARSGLIQARYDYRIGLAQLESLIGRSLR